MRWVQSHLNERISTLILFLGIDEKKAKDPVNLLREAGDRLYAILITPNYSIPPSTEPQRMFGVDPDPWLTAHGKALIDDMGLLVAKLLKDHSDLWEWNVEKRKSSISFHRPVLVLNDSSKFIVDPELSSFTTSYVVLTKERTPPDWAHMFEVWRNMAIEAERLRTRSEVINSDTLATPHPDTSDLSKNTYSDVSIQATYAYDKAKYHYESVEQLGLPIEHADHHTLFFLRWLIENDMMSEEFNETSKDVMDRFRHGKATMYDIYEWWDTCLLDIMLSARGNAFAIDYFDFEKGRYMDDYAEVLVQSLPSEFHVKYTEENYQLLRERIDRRYLDWIAENP